MSDGCAIVYFLDVGQGTCQVIDLGGGRAIVIDGGPTGDVVARLSAAGISSILSLIVSHNDSDHQRGALEILEHFQGAIHTLYFLEDRPVDRIGLYSVAKRFMESHSLAVYRLELDDTPRILFRDEQSDLTLELLYPSFLDNLTNRLSRNSNSTSGVLALFCGSRRVVFPGDATLAAWKRIRERLGGPIPCDVLAVPHHGGVIWERQQRRENATDFTERISKDLNWLYTEAIACDYAVISASTTNAYGHPQPCVIEALKSAGGRNRRILCTQITEQCCPKAVLQHFGSDRPEVSTHEVLIDMGSQLSNGVACAGTVIVKVNPDSVTVSHISEHQNRVQRMKDELGGHPLCLTEMTVFSAGKEVL
jgi:beta-lactamase superfamily II metal-dependent hydrolase